MSRRLILAVLAALALPITARAAPTDAQLDALEAQVAHAEDIEAVQRLTFIFGYYRDKFLDDEMLSLFTDDAVADFAGGKYIGKASLRRFFTGPGYKPAQAIGKQGPQAGVMNDHIFMEQVITVAPDGRTAQGRFKDWNTQGLFGKSQTRSSGVYENSYVKQGGVWKISAMAYCIRFANPYLVNPRDIKPAPDAPPTPVFYPTDPNGPDKQSNYACHSWPNPGISPPMHYPNPVTGEFIHKP